jgi:hypothetical protein
VLNEFFKNYHAFVNLKKAMEMKNIMNVDVDEDAEEVEYFNTHHWIAKVNEGTDIYNHVRFACIGNQYEIIEESDILPEMSEQDFVYVLMNELFENYQVFKNIEKAIEKKNLLNINNDYDNIEKATEMKYLVTKKTYKKTHPDYELFTNHYWIAKIKEGTNLYKWPEFYVYNQYEIIADTEFYIPLLK